MKRNEVPTISVSSKKAKGENKRTVVIGLLGPTLDNGHGPKRWAHWRPTVALC